jgi:hydroxymethylpyrimidine/phosphomethylpyrimidine kinase
MSRACVLAIGGSDAAGGAGIGADVLTIAAHGVHPAVAISAVTAQDDTGVRSSHHVPAMTLADQIDVAHDSCHPAAIKTGMLCSAELVEVVAEKVKLIGVPLIVDPVIAASSGSALIDAEGLRAMRELLLPLASLVTPNTAEAALLAPGVSDPLEQAVAIRELGARWVVVTGGHVEGPPVDLLVGPSGARRLEGERVHTVNDRGTGCTFASATACNLALGEDMPSAVQAAGSFVREGLEQSYPLANARGTLKRV